MGVYDLKTEEHTKLETSDNFNEKDDNDLPQKQPVSTQKIL